MMAERQERGKPREGRRSRMWRDMISNSVFAMYILYLMTYTALAKERTTGNIYQEPRRGLGK